jgi:hypothetical protein
MVINFFFNLYCNINFLIERERWTKVSNFLIKKVEILEL